MKNRNFINTIKHLPGWKQIHEQAMQLNFTSKKEIESPGCLIETAGSSIKVVLLFEKNQRGWIKPEWFEAIVVIEEGKKDQVISLTRESLNQRLPYQIYRNFLEPEISGCIVNYLNN